MARLIRPLLGTEYAEVNRCFREAGRLLAVYRDPHARLDGFDKLVASFESPPQELLSVRFTLAQTAEANAEQLLRDQDLIARVDELVRVGKLRFDRWEIDDDGWDALSPGVAANYRRGRAALDLALAEPTPFNLHEFRKYAKYLRNHLRLIAPSAPSMIKPVILELKTLADGLGDAHDLALLSDWLVSGDSSPGIRSVDRPSTSDPALDRALGLIADRQRTLETNCMALATRLYVESPKQLTARLGSYWDIWQQKGPRTGPLSLDRMVDAAGAD